MKERKVAAVALGPWFRCYCDVYSNPKLRLLDEGLQLRFVWMLALHRQGHLVGKTATEIAWRLRLDERQVAEEIEALKKARLLEKDLAPVGWSKRQFESDCSTGRVQKFRAGGEGDGGPEAGPAAGSTFPPDSMPFKVAKALAVSVKSWKPDCGSLQREKVERTLQGWAADVDLAIRRDGRSPEKLLRLIAWLPSHEGGGDFKWREQILSGKKLREQYDKLDIAFKRDNPEEERQGPALPPGVRVEEDYERTIRERKEMLAAEERRLAEKAREQT